LCQRGDDVAERGENVRQSVEGCDQVITVGSVMSDFNTGAFTSNLDPARTIAIHHHRTRVGGKLYQSVEMGDLLAVLTKRLPRGRTYSRFDMKSLGPISGSQGDPITAATLYPRWAAFLKPNDILIAETGTVSMGLAFAHMPSGAGFHNQTLWGSIGWATPAAFGAAVAAPDSRVILVTGDGSHQLTAQEIAQFSRYGLKPVIFVLNNEG
jgi:indolepyruvate decarboxylase